MSDSKGRLPEKLIKDIVKARKEGTTSSPYVPLAAPVKIRFPKPVIDIHSKTYDGYLIDEWRQKVKTETDEQYYSENIELLSKTFHEIYQKEAKRQGDVRHKDDYYELPENIKDFDRVLARYVAEKFIRKKEVLEMLQE